MIKKILILLTFTLNVYSQELSNRIIIWDITLSTLGLSFSKGVQSQNPDKNIFGKLKSSLIKKIESIPDDGGQIHLLQFREDVKYNQTFVNNINGKQQLLNFVKGYDLVNIPANRGNTNIAGAWEEGSGLIGPNAVNEIYLYTDGEQNVRHNGDDPKVAFARIIKKYCTFTQKLNSILFFVSLDAGFDQATLDLLNGCQTKLIFIDCGIEDPPGIISVKPKMSFLRLNLSDNNLTIKQRFYTDAGFTLDKFPFTVSLQIPNTPPGFLLDLKPNSYQLNKDGDVEIKTEIVAGDWKNYLKVSDTIHANLLLKSNYTKTDFIVAFANNGNLPLIIVNRPKKTISFRKTNND